MLDDRLRGPLLPGCIDCCLLPVGHFTCAGNHSLAPRHHIRCQSRLALGSSSEIEFGATANNPEHDPSRLQSLEKTMEPLRVSSELQLASDQQPVAGGRPVGAHVNSAARRAAVEPSQDSQAPMTGKIRRSNTVNGRADGLRS